MGEAQEQISPYQSLLHKYASSDKGRRRVLQALECALDVFAREGFEQVTLREVARRISMSIGNLQHYFPTREVLLDAMLTYVMLQYDVAYSSLQGMEAPTARDRFERVVRYLIADIRNPRTNGVFFELWALANRGGFASQVMTKMYRHHVENIENLLCHMTTDLSPNLARAKAVLIASLIEGLMLFLAERQEKFFDGEQVIQMAVDQILGIASDTYS